MKNKTPIQKAMDFVNEEGKREISPSYRGALIEMYAKLETLLPVEERFVRDAYESAVVSTTCDVANFDKYYSRYKPLINENK